MRWQLLIFSRKHNMSRFNEVAVIIPNDYTIASHRDIVLAQKNVPNESQFKIISLSHGAYTPLHYVLFFPFGDQCWNWSFRLQHRTNPNGTPKRLSKWQYYQFRLHPLLFEPATLFQGGRFLQQYLLAAFATVDQTKLEWIKLNQFRLRSVLYNGLVDGTIRDEVDVAALGRRIVLPSSFLGGDRFMQQLFQDSMAIVRHLGRPTLFITFTANRKWKEIQDKLLLHQSAIDRPDLIAGIFHLKQQNMLCQLRKDQIFGKFLGMVWTIEYQKRGQPHMHFLLFLRSEDRFLTPERIDEIVCAKLPSQEQDPNG